MSAESVVVMTYVLDLARLAAAVFAVPQFVPQLRRALSTGEIDGVSWSWAALTSVGNAAWTVYFAWSGYWLALVPSVSASSMAAVLAVSIARSSAPGRRKVVLVAGWVLVLTVSLLAGGRVGLGTVLSVAFVVQVAPAVWTAYRTQAPTGIATGTWLLVLGELTCWGPLRALPGRSPVGGDGCHRSSRSGADDRPGDDRRPH